MSEKKKKKRTIVFKPQIVKPGQEAVFRVSPGELFRGEHLLTTHETDNVMVDGIWVGHQLQLAGDVPRCNVPLSAFSPNELDNEMLFDTCMPPLDITIWVTNHSKQPRTIGFKLEGLVIR